MVCWLLADTTGSFCLVTLRGLPAPHTSGSCCAVMNKVSGEVYLEGQLERGIVPEESVWEHGGGSGQDGCLLYLHKMNLELLRK